MLQTDCALLKPSALITQFPWPSLVGLNVLDLACGSGRNGLWFLAQGADVTFVDSDLSRLHVEHPNAHKLQWDLEAHSAPILPVEAFDIVLVFNYLHRPLLAQIAASVKSKGFVVYETFTWRQAEIGRPRNLDFLLIEHELKSAFANWQPLHYFEGQLSESHSDRMSFKAQIIAQKW